MTAISRVDEYVDAEPAAASSSEVLRILRAYLGGADSESVAAFLASAGFHRREGVSMHEAVLIGLEDAVGTPVASIPADAFAVLSEACRLA